MDAQSRVINVHSLHHFNTVITPNDDGDVLDRYVLLAFYDSSIQGCEDKLQLEILYPWPFAGFSRDGGDGMWWGRHLFLAYDRMHTTCYDRMHTTCTILTLYFFISYTYFR
jgi:hypothetical protein